MATTREGHTIRAERSTTAAQARGKKERPLRLACSGWSRNPRSCTVDTSGAEVVGGIMEAAQTASTGPIRLSTDGQRARSQLS